MLTNCIGASLAICLTFLAMKCGDEPLELETQFVSEEREIGGSEDFEESDRDVETNEETREERDGEESVGGDFEETESFEDSVSGEYEEADDYEDDTGLEIDDLDSESHIVPSTDGPSDEKAGLGQRCRVDIVGLFEVQGRCRLLGQKCDGGLHLLNPGGTCQFGLVCCVQPDQCNHTGLDIMVCSDTACPGLGDQVGCPDSGWCCLNPIDI